MTDMQGELVPYQNYGDVDSAVTPYEWYATEVNGEPVWAYQDELGGEHFNMPEAPPYNQTPTVELAARLGNMGIHVQGGANMTRQEAAALGGVLDAVRDAVVSDSYDDRGQRTSRTIRGEATRTQVTYEAAEGRANRDYGQLINNVDLAKVGRKVGVVAAAWLLVGTGFGVGNTVSNAIRHTPGAMFHAAHLGFVGDKLFSPGTNPNALSFSPKHDIAVIVGGPVIGTKDLIKRFTD